MGKPEPATLLILACRVATSGCERSTRKSADKVDVYPSGSVLRWRNGTPHTAIYAISGQISVTFSDRYHVVNEKGEKVAFPRGQLVYVGTRDID